MFGYEVGVVDWDENEIVKWISDTAPDAFIEFKGRVGGVSVYTVITSMDLSSFFDKHVKFVSCRIVYAGV